MPIVNRIPLDLNLISVLLAIGLALMGRNAGAQTVAIPRQYHAWGRFTPGSWSKVRKWTEELDARGNVKSASTTETKTTLLSVDASGCTLQAEVTVELAGKRFVAQPRQIRKEFDGGAGAVTSGLRKVGDKALEFSGKAVNCKSLEATAADGDQCVISRLEYSDSVPPFVVRRETVTTNADGKQILEQTVMDTIAIEMPQKVLTEIKSAAYVRTVLKQQNGSTHTLEVYCLDVPGGVVSHTSKDLDATGQLVSRSTLELLDYGVAVPSQTARRPTVLFHRSRRTLQQTRP